MTAQPTGVVTLLFTDIEGSTRLLQRLGADRYHDGLELHRSVLREAFERHGGYEVDTEGDAFFVAFASAGGAVAAAEAAQRGLAAVRFAEDSEIRVRMGLHTGEPLVTPPRYVGLDVHKAARVMAAGHGGQVLLSKSTRALLDDTVTVRELGEHLLKDLLQPEPLYQLVVEGLPNEFPALKTLGNRPNNLPVQPNALIGRRTELEALTGLLRDPEVRLVTLTGPGGTGKTRLALQAAAELVDDFSGGVYFVSLAPVDEPELVVPTIAHVLGVREAPGDALDDSLASYLESKRLLLVLDNFEQVVEAAGEIGRLLDRCRGVTVVVTSRERLRLGLERTYAVPALDPNDSVALFFARAGAVVPELVLDEDTASVVAEIGARLDGLPLAIELAAARTAALSPRGILDRLDRRLALLATKDRDVDNRQRTLRAAIAWSYDLLAEDDKALLGRLGVFVDGCRLEAAEAVCAGAEHEDALVVLDGLTSLIEKSLLRRRLDPDGEPRYWLLETIREFALERLAADSDERQEVERRHAVATADLATALRARLQTIGADEAYGLFEAETQNIRAALSFADRAADGALYVRLSNAVAMSWYVQGHVAEGVTNAQRALAYAETLGEAETAATLPVVTFLRAVRGETTAELRQLADRGVELAERVEDRALLLWALDAKAAVASNMGDDEESEASYRRELELAAELHDPWFEMTSLGNLSHKALGRGDGDEALVLAERAAARARELGDTSRLAFAVENAGAALVVLRREQEGRQFLEEAARLAQSVGYEQMLAATVTGLAVIAAREGDAEGPALLLGYADELLEAGSFLLFGLEQRWHEEITQALEHTLPDDRRVALLREGGALARAGALGALLERTRRGGPCVSRRGA